MARKQLKETIAENIRRLRQKAGISQAELAKKSKLSIRYVSLLETRPKNISVDSLEGIARALGRTACDLICDHSEVSKSRKAALKAAIESLQRELDDLEQ